MKEILRKSVAFSWFVLHSNVVHIFAKRWNSGESQQRCSLVTQGAFIKTNQQMNARKSGSLRMVSRTWQIVRGATGQGAGLGIALPEKELWSSFSCALEMRD